MDDQIVVSQRDLIVTALVVALLGTALLALSALCEVAGTFADTEVGALRGIGILALIYSAITALSEANLRSVATSGVAFTIVMGVMLLV